ncbi:hypothetical protein [Amycolatopsis sp. CA-128772]|nr:hypothetical protein [Amycolatopsis sp. CA-128772]
MGKELLWGRTARPSPRAGIAATAGDVTRVESGGNAIARGFSERR